YFNGGVQGLTLGADGAIAPAQEPVQGPQQNGLAITPDGHFAYTVIVNPASPKKGVLGYSIGANGVLTPLAGSPFGSGTYFDAAISPDGRYLFATNTLGVQAFALGADGSVASLGFTSVANAFYLQTAPDSPLLYVVSSHSSGTGVTPFAIGPDGSLSQRGQLAETGDVSLDYIGVSPDNKHIYMPDSNLDGIVTANVGADGSLTVANTMSVENPESAAVTPDGRFLYWWQGGGSNNHIGVASIGPDGTPTPLPFETAWDTGEIERLVFQPQPTPVARFSATAAAVGQASRFDAGGSERAAHYEWNFGDGTVLADGGATPTHVYANSGDYQVTLVVTDAQGCSAKQVYTGQSTVCPGGTAARTEATVTIPAANKSLNQKPKLGKIRAVPRAFAPKLRGAKPGKVKLGTTFVFTVSEPATVRFKFERKQGKRFKKLGSRSKAAKTGKSKLNWNGRLKGKPLAPGRYRATVVATDKEGARSAPKTVGFRILSVPPPR
ncbi:MAG TPA: PKD domain-containing protein, partial [Solirubrobacterales bacterium]|nr:PKD domain-containing protein [Solirubrobacterales bacterium]